MVNWLSLSPIGLAKRTLGYRSLKTAQVIQRNLGNIASPTQPSGKGIGIPELGIVIDPSRHEDILKVSTELVSLKRRQGATFRVLDDALLEITVAGISVVTETIQDMICVHEIYDSWVYAMEFDGAVTVWDIGTNIGTASLFFAGCRGWDVVAYEPFPKTAEAAQRNITRNNLQDKVDLTIAGIGGSTRTETVRYHHDWRAGNGIFGNSHENAVDEGVSVQIQVLDAAEQFQRVRARAMGRIVAKIDCEGAEYEILRRLRETGDLRLIDVVILEVHPMAHEDSQEPMRLLLESGFSVIHMNLMKKDYYLLHAARLSVRDGLS